MNTEEKIQEINDILGFGQKIKMLVGADADGKEIIKTYHITPVSVSEMPIIMEKLGKFFDNADVTKWTKENSDNAAEIILMSVKKMHPDVTLETVSKDFSLGTLARAVKVVMDINDFFTEMQQMNNQMLQSGTLMKS